MDEFLEKFLQTLTFILMMVIIPLILVSGLTMYLF